MNAAALADSRPLISSSIPEEAEHRTDRHDWSEAARAAGTFVWSFICLSGVAVLLICGCFVSFGILAMAATLLGGREGAWWPVITSVLLLYLLAKGCITCWDLARGGFSSGKRLPRA